MNISILGDGGWGTALGLVLQRNGHAVRIWGPFPEYIQYLRTHRLNAKFLAGVPLPDSLAWTADRTEAVGDADVVVLAIPSKFFPSVLESFRDLIPAGARLVSVAKGLSHDGHRRLSEVAASILGHGSVAALSGPSHAEEVARGVPTAVVVACADPDIARALQEAFSGPAFRVYTSDDVIGVELGGALKNIIALAAGVCDGIGYGDNTKAALITRGLAEMTRIGTALGAHPATFAGLSGMGDLIVTCGSRLSRNRGVGERLGRGESIDQILGSMEQVAEGVVTCPAARALAADLGVEAPITGEVYALLQGQKSPRDAVMSLMGRDLRTERG
jgi:glycerol-3-phosphate dehydrogenase (NAD(P)+)